MRHSYLDSFSNLDSPIHRLEARAKIILFFALVVVCVTTPAQAYAAFIGYLLVLLVLLFLSRLPLKHVFKRALVVVPFVLMVAAFIPFLRTDVIGGGYNLGGMIISQSGLLVLWNVVVKSSVGVLSVILLSSTTPFDGLLKGFERLKVPHIFTTIAAFMYRYSFVLIDEAMRMKRARDSRNFKGKWIWDAKVIGHMVGSLFMRSYERGERVYLAMLARGYDGRSRTLERERISAADVFFVITVMTLVVLVRILGSRGMFL